LETDMIKLTSRHRRLLAVATVGAVMATAGLAVAGDWVKGYGSTRSEALNDAERRAAARARSANRCYNQPDASNCSKDGVEWVCRVEVTHHNRSNPGQVCA
jgi:hypothetical protein